MVSRWIGLGFSLWHPRATGSRPALPVQNMSGTPCSRGERRRFLRQAIGGRRRRRNDRFYIGTEVWRDRRAAISQVGRRGLRGPVERTIGYGGAGFLGRRMRRCRAAGLGMRQISLGFDHPDRKPGRVLSPKRVPKPKVCLPNASWPFIETPTQSEATEAGGACVGPACLRMRTSCKT